MKVAQVAYYEAYRGINIQDNEKIVLESKDLEYCYWFARYVPLANIKAFEEAILENKDHSWCYFFAKDVKESNKEELFKVVLESGDKDYINNFLKYIDFNKEKFADYLLFI